MRVIFIFFLPLLLFFLPRMTYSQGDINYISGIKNIFGGILAVDNVHRNCLQKTLCEQFSDQVVRMLPAEGVNRNGRQIYVPTVVQERGHLRFIGDFFVKMGSTLMDRLSHILRRRGGKIGISNRQLGASALNIANANFVTRGIATVYSMLRSIPSNAIISVMDFVADFTNVMSRHGAVYPFVRAASVGYGYGNRRSDDSQGVCKQLATNCRSWWDHFDVLNEYDGGTLPRQHTFKSQSFDRSKGIVNYDDPITWNQIKVRDLSSPKIFLCKAGKFLEKLSTEMGAFEVVRERFGSEDFEESCNPNFSSLQSFSSSTPEESNSIDDYVDGEEDVEILEIGRSYNTDGIDNLPILVFEGLPKPKVDETEVDFVERMLSSSLGLPSSSVRNAIRLPIRRGERDIVLVEMDTEAHENVILQRKQSVRKVENKRDLGIRKARYKELWRYVEDLLAIKSSSVSDQIVREQGTIVVEA